MSRRRISQDITVTDIPAIPERIRARVNFDGPPPPDPWRPVEGGCWLWEGGTFPAGYGSISIDNQTQLVHRVVYEAVVGPIPEGHEVDHVCRVRLCIRHLEAVTPAENMHRAQRSHCRRGHPFTAANTIRVKGKPHQRVCRTCRAVSRHAYRQRKRGAAA